MSGWLAFGVLGFFVACGLAYVVWWLTRQDWPI